jgi:SAM-dependent methyltransferase
MEKADFHVATCDTCATQMTELAERLRVKYFAHQEHPYRTFQRTVESLLRPDSTLLDAGCGRTAPMLEQYRGRARRLIGVDVVAFDGAPPGLELLSGDLRSIPIPDGCVDLVMSRAVLEHLEEPVAVYAEIARVLKPGAHFVFLTPNLWDYASLIASLVPNRLHPRIVAWVEGRQEQDVFPVHYRSNTRRAVDRLASSNGFQVDSIRFLGQHPSYFMFNGALFFLATGYEKLISRFEALRFLRGWILAVLRKPPD